MYFEDYSRKILSLYDHEAINNKRTELRKIKKRLRMKNGKMNMTRLSSNLLDYMTKGTMFQKWSENMKRC